MNTKNKVLIIFVIIIIAICFYFYFKTSGHKNLFKTPKFKPMQMIGANKAVFGVHMGTLNDNDLMRKHSTELLNMLENGTIDPIIDSVFRFEDCIKAHEHIHQRKNIGKVLLDFS